MRYYVYLHRDINGIVFYIGKGCGNRYKVKCIRVAFYSINGKLYRKFFSHDKLGKEQAIALAKEWRTIHVKDEK